MKEDKKLPNRLKRKDCLRKKARWGDLDGEREEENENGSLSE